MSFPVFLYAFLAPKEDSYKYESRSVFTVIQVEKVVQNECFVL